MKEKRQPPKCYEAIFATIEQDFLSYSFRVLYYVAQMPIAQAMQNQCLYIALTYHIHQGRSIGLKAKRRHM